MKNKILLLITGCVLITTDSAYSQVGIGTEEPAKSSILDVTSIDKGVLFPRVDLQSTTMDLDGAEGQDEGLVVYNIGNTLAIGLYYWNGTEWKIFDSSTAIAPKITDLLCGGATLSPSAYYENSQYTGVMKIPYTGGNGGRYTAGVSVTKNGMTFILQEGKLENGSGELVFNVSGTPTVTSPVATTITIDEAVVPFYEDDCEATVGDQITADIVSVAVIDNLILSEDNGVRGYGTRIDTPDGKFSIRAFIISNDYDPAGATFGTDGYAGINLQIRNNSNEDVVVAGIFQYLYGGALTGGMASNALVLQPNVWSGSNLEGVQNQPVSNPLHAVKLSGNAIAGTYPAAAQGNRNIVGRLVSLGNAGVQAGGAPEYRIYSWMVNDGIASKTSYVCTFSSASHDPSQLANNTNCPNGICDGSKVYLKIEQITAP